MNPGVIIVHLTKGRLSHRYNLDLTYQVHQPRDFEWMYKKDKITWFEKLYQYSTIEEPEIHQFVCTTPDLFNYLYAKKKEEADTTDTLVLAIVHEFDDVIDSIEFYV